MRAHLDTHVAIWLVMGAKKRLRGVERSLRRAALFVSPVVVVEMEFLREIGRINEPVEKIMEILTEDHGVQQARGELADVGREARLLGWTRDPFDRFIVAYAIADGATLFTADATIREHCPLARWDE